MLIRVISKLILNYAYIKLHRTAEIKHITTHAMLSADIKYVQVIICIFHSQRLPAAEHHHILAKEAPIFVFTRL